jgi:hypothetical protein
MRFAHLSQTGVVGLCESRNNSMADCVGRSSADAARSEIRKRTEVEMQEGQSSARIELKAARLAVEWKSLFATELELVAERLAENCDLVTADHYRQALPEAVSRLLHAVETQSVERHNAERRVA